jgi:hypothetical protein
MKLESQIHDIVTRAAHDIASAVRADVAAQVGRIVNGVAAVAGAARAQIGAAKGGKRGGRRRRGIGEQSLDAVYQFVAKNPGKRSEEIQKSAGLAPAIAKKALVKLRGIGRLKMKGEKRAATYTVA